jgi:diguanylate cyclase (GGDEF)-like protein/PAS domain S-box-containing protein
MTVASIAGTDARTFVLEARFRFRLAPNLRVLSASGYIEALLGFNPQDFLSSRVDLFERIHHRDRELSRRIRRLEPRGEQGTCSLRIRHADGRIRCLRVAYFKQYDSGSGETILDLLLQKPTIANGVPPTAPLAVSLQAILENTDDIIFFKDCNHVFTQASQSMLRAVKPMLKGQDLIGLTEYDYLPEEQADSIFETEQRVFDGAPMSRELMKIVQPNGDIKWMDDRKFLIRGEGGEVLGLFAITRDITDWVQAEQTLRESEESLKESQRIARVGSYVLDLRTGDWASSEELEALFGIPRKKEHRVGEWPEILHPDDREEMWAYFLDEVAGKGTPFDKEYRIVRASDQSVRWVHGLGKLEFDAEGKPVLMQGTIQDITERKLAEASLRESKELLQLFIEHAPAALAMFDREMRYLAVSPRWLQDYGLKGREVIGRPHYALVPDLPENWKEAHRRGLEGESVRKDEDRFERADGTVQWRRWELRPWRTAHGDVGGIVIFNEDITRAKEAEERLRLAAGVFTNASEAIVISALDGSILEVNDTFTRITGYTRDEVLGQNPRILKSGRQGRDFYDKMWRSVLEDGRWSGEIWNQAKNGDLFAAYETITTVFDAEGKPQHYVGLMTDITPIKEQEQKLERVVHFDALTGLPNRVLLAERLRQAMLKAGPHQMVAVAYLDLDEFKAINDAHGRETGDALLAALANRMKQVIREGDTLARIGGDEFVAVLRHLDGENSAVLALTRLLRALSELVQIGDLVLQVSASTGLAIYPQAEEVDGDQLLRQADRAMNEAKLDGKGRYHLFDPAHDRTLRGRVEDIENVRRALEAREFVLFFQPRVNMATGSVVGAEALIRWQHPQRGLLAPSMFLPVIEDHPLAVEVGHWVIESALRQLEDWKAKGLNIPISANIGAKHLQEPDFVERLRALLAAHPEVDPANLELELLETSALWDMAHVSEVIGRCRELGVSVAIDDFGTGYSSLTYLKRLPANVLKIDQSFVCNMLSDPEDLAILEGVLGLATAFRRTAVAEGVETVDHGVMLLQLGCELGQGYGIARPMPGSEFPAWAESWKPDPRWARTEPVSPADWPVLYAGIEHIAWLKGLEAYLRGERNEPPGLDAGECRMGAWLQTETDGPRGATAAFQRIADLHRRAHELAACAIAWKAGGHEAEGRNCLAELRHALDDALGLLNSLIHKN